MFRTIWEWFIARDVRAYSARDAESIPTVLREVMPKAVAETNGQDVVRRHELESFKREINQRLVRQELRIDAIAAEVLMQERTLDG